MFESGAEEGPHTIFLFDEDDCAKVLDAYAALLMETFSEAELQNGTFTAVGAVHKAKSDADKPRHVCHYWPDYDPELTGKNPRPKTFVQHIYAGQAIAELVGESYPVVEKTAEAVLRLAGMGGGNRPIRLGRHCHRRVLELLDSHARVKECYRQLVATFAINSGCLTKTSWESSLSGTVRGIATALAGQPLSDQNVSGFLAWTDAPDGPPPLSGALEYRDNTCRRTHAGKAVAIRIGSIHSVKGETHTATLVMETFWNDHNLEKILPWLDGTKSGHTSPSSQQGYRLKLHYVAMTRPTHLLCLAMKRNTFEDSSGSLKTEMIARLEQQGWQVRLI